MALSTTLQRAPAHRAGARRLSPAGLVGPLVGAALVAAWVVVSPRTPDLAAQFYRVYLWRVEGLAIFDNFWYAGHTLPGYSLLFPPLGAALGLRAAGAVACCCSLVLGVRLLRRLAWGVVWMAEVALALAVAGDLWIGRLSYALGVAFGLAALSAAVGPRKPRRRLLAALLAAATAAASPVAGLLLAFFAVCAPAALALGQGLGARRAARAATDWWEVVVAATLVTVAMQAAFPEGGHEPYSWESLLPALAVTLAVAAAAPRWAPSLRHGALLYALLNVVCELPTPMGSNVERLGVLALGPLLLAVWQGRRWSALRPTTGVGKRLLAGAAALGAVFWTVWGPFTQTAEVVGEAAVHSSFYAPLERFLAAADRGPVRIEVPFTRAHWEAALLARRFALARGWERQLDKLYNRNLEYGLTPASYHRWLERDGVSYVALPAVPLDPSSKLEARVIRSHPGYLRLVALLPGWQVFKVRHPTALVVPADGPPKARGARLVSVGHSSFELAVERPGTYLVRIHFTPYWRSRPSAVLREGRYGFTVVEAKSPGLYLVSPTFTLGGLWRSVQRFLALL